ncbi:hypothetical protein AWC04_18055 [Mycolicibacterium fallax]|uniref:Uncharacterized protein n=1 Tax=Mycolicibacterium fallax TaxID=1793 RepID=A0A1X1R2M2_MYCFA|nr:hypothetical protein AWC04_18055 [Mycolicibacterium fallax]
MERVWSFLSGWTAGLEMVVVAMLSAWVAAGAALAPVARPMAIRAGAAARVAVAAIRRAMVVI